MGLRTELKNVSENAFKTLYEWEQRSNGWLSHFLSVPLMLTFQATTNLETQSEKTTRLSNARENELLYGIRRMIYNPVYLLGSDECRSKYLQDFKGDKDTFTVREMEGYLENDFSKVWGSVLVFGNRKQNLDFIAQYALRKVNDQNDKQALRGALESLMNNPETFGYDIPLENQIYVDDALEHIETINNQREKKIKELASIAVFNHGLGVSFTGYDTIRKNMINKNKGDWLQRYDITPDDVLNYAIDNAENIIDTKYSNMEEVTKSNLRKGMATLKEQRDGIVSPLHRHNEI